jgi:DNA-binding protein HU-beta
MKKNELISLISEDTKINKSIIKEVVDSMCNNIMKSLINDENVYLVGFGSFSVIDRKARKGRNPQTGKEIFIEAMKSPKFKFSQTLKDKLNNK